MKPTKEQRWMHRLGRGIVAAFAARLYGRPTFRYAPSRATTYLRLAEQREMMK